MQNIIHSALRLLQFLLVLLTTALIGNVIATNWGAAGSAKAAVNFIMFVCALSWIAVLYGLISHFVSAAAMPIVALALDAAATLFTFIGAVVLSAKLTAVNCGSNFHNKPSDWVAFGGNDTEKHCREIQASVVFLWFLFAAFAASLFFAFKAFRGRGGSMGRPSMSQVGV
ncbi:Uu.00g105380.m01.CDS01 [Anthostomella pinea]|uniref:Uu.00g105380.m01.CDS01 n=1 Tax=Anthostomella pinea TaxID=933095 RepID=A0AAI8VEM2_9PEZI|nr:Uu.00g105380.m01.CDS01 [Anthostomella pinea]